MDAPSATKVKILLAAAEVTTTCGAAHLTLDRVAEEAAVSKGGLLYHYPNKRALLAGMLEYLLGLVRERLAEHEQQGAANHPRPVARSLILAESEQAQAERAMAQALLAAAAEDPQLLDPARVLVRQLFDAAGAEGDFSLLLLLATEGLRFLDVLDLLPDPQRDRPRLLRALLAAAEHRA